MPPAAVELRAERRDNGYDVQVREKPAQYSFRQVSGLPHKRHTQEEITYRWSVRKRAISAGIRQSADHRQSRNGLLGIETSQSGAIWLA